MTDPFPLPSERVQRARAIHRLRAAVNAALVDGRAALERDLHVRSLAQPLLDRLEQIGRELDRMEGLRSGWDGEETHPFWIDLLNEVKAQTPCGKSPPPENASR